jgi:linoleoyl-CoA desaturase
MHDAGHKSFSSRQWVNDLFSLSGNLVGIHVGFWKVKHNALHHSFTNILGFDDDIDLYPLIRVDASQKLRWFHRIQFLYAIPLYAFYLLFWIYILDFIRFFKRKIGEQPIEAKYRNPWLFFGTKLFHIMVFPVAAYLTHGWHGILGYLLCVGIAGVVLTFVFQCAHLVKGVHMESTETMTAVTDRFTHQMLTTANFAPNSRVLAWYIGGLNKQIEHHLFPQIAQMHYKDISPGLKSLCAKHNLPYVEFSTFFSAVWSHLWYLWYVGRI